MFQGDKESGRNVPMNCGDSFLWLFAGGVRAVEVAKHLECLTVNRFGKLNMYSPGLI